MREFWGSRKWMILGSLVHGFVFSILSFYSFREPSRPVQKEKENNNDGERRARRLVTPFMQDGREV